MLLLPCDDSFRRPSWCWGGGGMVFNGGWGSVTFVIRRLPLKPERSLIGVDTVRFVRGGVAVDLAMTQWRGQPDPVVAPGVWRCSREDSKGERSRGDSGSGVLPAGGRCCCVLFTRSATEHASEVIAFTASVTTDWPLFLFFGGLAWEEGGGGG